MKNNNNNSIIFDGSMTAEQFAEKLQEMRQAVMFDGQQVISEKVTDKIRFCQEKDAEMIAAAGVSGMTKKDGLTVNKKGLFISNNYGGKMKNIAGLSGFAGNNAKCVKRAKSGKGVCPHCFSFIGSKFSNLAAWTKNDTILSTVTFELGDIILDPEMVPEMRYSTHGDLINSLHAYNLLIIAASNPETQFTLWTKNHAEYAAGLAMFEAKYGRKPANMRVIFSASQLDQMFTEKQLQALKKHGYDAVFAVYNTWDSQARAVAAGAKKCVCGLLSCKEKCHFCYAARSIWEKAGLYTDKVVWIAEIMDGDKHKE